jgi:hypothetical protein
VLEALRQSADRWPAGTMIMVDRRAGDRRVRMQRTVLERRRRQRRVEPDSTWYTQGFIVVETPRAPADAVLLERLARYPGVHVDRALWEAGQPAGDPPVTASTPSPADLPPPLAGANGTSRDEAGPDLLRSRTVTQLARELIDRRRQWLCPVCSRPLQGSGEVLVQGQLLVHAACRSGARSR